MSATDKYLTYRGDLRAIAASGATLVFVTAHPEGQRDHAQANSPQ